MFVQTEITPNPNSLKFLPGKSVSLIGPVEIIEINKTNNELIRNILSINGVKGVFLSNDFISVNKHTEFEWEFSKIERSNVAYLRERIIDEICLYNSEVSKKRRRVSLPVAGEPATARGQRRTTSRPG